MCGPNALFVGQIGDWTWETVSDLCDTNVFAARTASGAPTYLAFYYYHIRASASFHPGQLNFGDPIRVVSTAFDFGSESVLALHEIRPDGLDAGDVRPIDYTEFYDRPRRGTIYVETFNRWITRSAEKSNESLVRSSPATFAHDRLQALPEQYSPRPVYGRARRVGTFLELDGGEYTLLHESETEHRVDVVRDLNGVGLVYFAAYFSIIDTAIWRLWSSLRRDDRAFMDRIVTDYKVCYLGNANAGTVLTLDTKLYARTGADREEAFNVVMADRESGRKLAVATVVSTAP
jgi:probable biosynthetic protein (TIGR04098 family)